MDVNNLQRLQNKGTFGDPTSNHPSHIPIDVLLTFPFLWKSSKLLNFIRDSQNCIKDQEWNNEIKKFREEMQEDSNCVFATDWVSVLGEDDWAILQGDGGRAKQPDKTRMRNTSGASKNLPRLLRLIRNKVEHAEKMDEKEQSVLKWFTDGNFDDTKFVTYWTDKFGKLFTFAWFKFYKLKNKNLSRLSPYYCYSFDHYNLHSLYDWEKETILEEFITQMYTALEHHFDVGGLLKRYTYKCTAIGHDQQSSTLEFMVLKPAAIENLLDGSSSVRIDIKRNDSLSFTWQTTPATDNDKRGTMKYKCKNEDSDTLVACHQSGTTTIIVANNIKDEHLIHKTTSNRVIFAVHEYHAKDNSTMQYVAKKFASVNKVELRENPLKWDEISLSKRQSVLEESKVVFQKKTVTLRHLLPESCEEEELMLSHLNGHTLNTLLTEGKINLFKKHKVPDLQKTYIERRLLSLREVSSKVLRHRVDDIIVVTNISLEELQKMVTTNEEIYNLNSIDYKIDLKNRILLLENNLHSYTKVLEYFKSLLSKNDNRNIHCIEYLKEDNFKWLGTCGKLSNILNSLPKKPSERVELEEDEFLSNIENERCEPVFIADKPGIGKSLVLVSLANKVREKFRNSLVVLLTMSEFIMKFNETHKNKQKGLTKVVILDIIENMVSNCDFERKLIRYWLEQSWEKPKIIMELMLDGLDEVGKKHKELAMSILKMIRKKLPTVRLWVTLREYMEEDIKKNFTTLAYKIQPFSEEDQIKFLQNYWSSKFEHEEEFNSEALKKLAMKVIKLTENGTETAEIAGAPLQCRMLAEIHEDNLHDLLIGGNTSLSSISLTELYEKMIENTFKIYLTVKVGVSYERDHIVDSIRKDTHKSHMYFAIKLLFPDWLTDTFCIYLNFTPETADGMGTIAKEVGLIENLDPIRFIHRTFADYFVALFIYKVLSGEFQTLHDADVTAFQTFVTSQVLEVTKKKYQCSYDCTTGTSKPCPKFKYPILCYFLNAMLENVEVGQISSYLQNSLHNIYDFSGKDSTFDCSKSVILATAQHNFFVLSRILIESLKMHQQGLIEFLERTKDDHNFMLEVSTRFADVSLYSYICSLIEEWHENNRNTFKIPVALFKLALVKGKYEIVKYLVENRGFGPESWHSFHISDKKGWGIIHHVISKSRSDKRAVLEEKKKLLKYIAQQDKTVLEQQDAEGRTPVLMQFSASFYLKTFLIATLDANVNATGKCHNTAFHWTDYSTYAKAVTPTQYHNMLETFVKFGFEKINLVNNNGCTPLHCAIKTYYDSLEERTLDVFKTAGADFNLKERNKNTTVLHICIQKNCRVEFVEKLITCGSNIAITNSKGQSALHLAVVQRNFPLVRILIEKFQADLEACDNDGKTAGQCVYDSDSEIKNYFEFFAKPSS